MGDATKHAARLLCVGFEGTSVTAELKRLLDGGVGGVILFKRNIESAGQVARLAAEIKEVAGRPIIIAIDQEGGRVARLREGFTSLPPMRTVGALSDEAMAWQVGRVLGREVRAVNIDLNFAPVMDVDTNPANPVIGDRSFSRDAEVVSRMGCAMLRGMQSAGVAACAKHFPGHGDTAQDSHQALPRLAHDMNRLNDVELKPFAAAVAADVASVMTAHVVFEAMDNAYPATMSRPALDGILRDRMRFDGVAISDDLEMKAIADHYTVDEAIGRGLKAGIDLFLVCHTPDVQWHAIESLANQVEVGQVTAGRFAEAVRRVDVMTMRYARPGTIDAWRQVLACDEHRAIAHRLWEGASAECELADPTDWKKAAG